MTADDSSRRAFISFTSEMNEHPAGRTFVQAARDACDKAGFTTQYMGHYEAEDATPMKVDDREVQACGAYIGLIGLRYGTPVSDRPDVSYTEHEFEVATEAKKTRLIFLLNEKAEGVPLEMALDPEHGARQKAFRERLQSSGVICMTFRNADQLYNLVLEALQKHRIKTDHDAKAPDDGPTIPGDYCVWLMEQCQDISLLGLQVNQGIAPLLSHVYVPLTTADIPPRNEEQLAEKIQNQFLPGGENWHSLILKVLGEQSLYVSGDAGTGKSTFSRWVALLAASDGDIEQDAEAPDNYREVMPEAFRDRLPVWVELRKFWESLPQGHERAHLTPQELEQLLGTFVARQCGGLTSAENVLAHLNAGSCLLILDGVDEVPTSEEKEGQTRYPRAMLLDGLAQAVLAWEKSGNRLLVTSRPYGLDAEDERRLGLEPVRVADLPKELQELLVRRWFRILEQGRGKPTADDMLAELRSRREIDALKANPMFLSALCVLFGAEGKQLPEDLHELYGRVVDNVLSNRFPRDTIAKDRARRRLSVVAYGMHTGQDLGKDWDDPVAEVSYDDIEQLLKAYRGDRTERERADEAVETIREKLLSETGLLVPRPQRRASFYQILRARARRETIRSPLWPHPTGDRSQILLPIDENALPHPISSQRRSLS